MKKLIIAICLIVLSVLVMNTIVYLGFAFTRGTLDFLKWQEDDRGFMAFVSIIFTLFITAFIIDNRNKF